MNPITHAAFRDELEKLANENPQLMVEVEASFGKEAGFLSSIFGGKGSSDVPAGVFEQAKRNSAAHAAQQATTRSMGGAAVDPFVKMRAGAAKTQVIPKKIPKFAEAEKTALLDVALAAGLGASKAHEAGGSQLEGAARGAGGYYLGALPGSALGLGLGGLGGLGLGALTGRPELAALGAYAGGGLGGLAGGIGGGVLGYKALTRKFDKDDKHKKEASALTPEQLAKLAAIVNPAMARMFHGAPAALNPKDIAKGVASGGAARAAPKLPPAAFAAPKLPPPNLAAARAKSQAPGGIFAAGPRPAAAAGAAPYGKAPGTGV